MWAELSQSVFFIEKIYYTQHILQEGFIQLQYSLFLQAFGNTGMSQVHGILECRNKVAKCQTTSLELLIFYRYAGENRQYSKTEFSALCAQESQGLFFLNMWN